MSIISGYKKFKKRIKLSNGFQLQSLWTNANTVEADDNRTIQTKVGAINGISSSATANSDDIAASTKLTNQLNRDFASGQMEIRLTDAGKGEYRKKGADTWIPFNSVTDLGTGTSFDVKAKYPNYKQLTANNFVIEPEALPDRILGGKGTHDVDNNNVYAWIRFTKTKSYNAETGMLTAYVTPSGGYGSSTTGVTDTASSNRPVHAYLIVT